MTARDELPVGLPRTELTDKQVNTAVSQYGSLGSGNHFVEVCLDERDQVWLVLHSGSRGIGNQLAKRHIAEARGLMKRYFISLEVPTSRTSCAALPSSTRTSPTCCGPSSTRWETAK